MREYALACAALPLFASNHARTVRACGSLRI